MRAILELPRLLLDALAPRGCAACDAALSHGEWFCCGCRAQLPAPGAAEVAGLPVIFGAPYGNVVKLALHRFKYSGRSDLAPALASLVVPALAAHDRIGEHLLVPVPLHPARLAERGYNQAALLARELGRRCGSPVAPLALQRQRATLQQAQQGRRERQDNVAGAFAPRQVRALAGRRVVLVDDVVTTGITALECARALVAAKASVVAVAAVAVAGREQTQ